MQAMLKAGMPVMVNCGNLCMAGMAETAERTAAVRRQMIGMMQAAPCAV